jgi:uncharacterized membrane protein YcaP (DUF421 family)
MAGENIFFGGWAGLIRTAVVSLCAYTALILLVRISGKRSLSRMNAFDLIVAVALGSTLATVLLSKDIALAEGVLALALLILFQFIITWLSVRYKSISRLVKAEPQLLFLRGEFLWNAMKRERVRKEELLQAIRSDGFSHLQEVEAVVLETDGSFSVLKNDPKDKATTLSNVDGMPDDQNHSGSRNP